MKQNFIFQVVECRVTAEFQDFETNYCDLDSQYWSPVDSICVNFKYDR